MILNFSKLADILMQEDSRLKPITQVHLSVIHSSITMKCFLNTSQLNSTVLSMLKYTTKKKKSLP